MDIIIPQTTVYNLEALADELKVDHVLLWVSICDLAIKVNNFRTETLQQVDNLKDWIELALCESLSTSPEFLVGDHLALLELKVYQLSCDFVTWPDYALHAAGRYILQEFTAVNRMSSEGWKEAEKILDNQIGVAACRSYPGEKAQVGIHLAAHMHIKQISIDHIPKELVPSSNHAPQDIIIWGIVDEENTSITQHPSLSDVSLLIKSPTTHTVPLAVITYNLTLATHVQTFPVLEYVLGSSVQFQDLIIQIKRNYSAESTCIYRVCVHGTKDIV